jgi:hypothetical protein
MHIHYCSYLATTINPYVLINAFFDAKIRIIPANTGNLFVYGYKLAKDIPAPDKH